MSGGKLGVEAKCWHSNGNIYNAYHISLLCARIGPVPSISYTDPAWNW